MKRRAALKLLAAALPALKSTYGPAKSQATDATAERIAPGPFQGTRESLAAYEVPQWFRDAKFGIWAHWGPQSAAETGDWYARNMYIQGEWQYKRHLEQYGHPSKFGFKNIIQTWKGDKFNPDYLVGLYKQAGAKYFMSMGVHHDNFDLWNSQHTRWNAVKMGPGRDIVRAFREAANRHGLRFGVSDHLWISYKWFAVSHLSDKEGPMAGVPYDGVDPRNSDLYHSYTDPQLLTAKLDWNEDGIPEQWKQHWFLRIKDLLDQHQPDLLYADGHIPFQEHGLKIVAHLYNLNAKRHGGRTEAVFTSKRPEDSAKGTCVLDHERGVVDKIWPAPWQTDTCIGNWHYQRGIIYKTPKRIIDLLVDIVSRNGNLLLNFPLPNSGMLDDQELYILEEIRKWMSVNGEAIYSTRPWKIFGNESAKPEGEPPNASFNENKRKDLTAEDVRFTSKGGTLYAFVMGWPQQQALITDLALPGKLDVGKIARVELLGHRGSLQWVQDGSGLKISLPREKPCDYAVVFKIAGIT
jgi:alpha-L-fucosidase